MVNDNPAWKPILDVLPESLHNIVKPALQDWDKGVQAKFQEIRNEYAELEAFRPYVEQNIDPAYVEQAVILADQLQRDPKGIVGNMIETWNLDYVSKEEAAKLGESSSPSGDESDLEFGDPEFDITKHPQFKQMQEALDNIQRQTEQTQQEKEQEAAVKEFESYLNTLEQDYTNPEREGGPLPFNRTFVTALMSQGLSGEDAVKQYHEALAIASSPGATGEKQQDGNENPAPPVVMGGQGTVGSGSPDQAVDTNALSRSDLNSTVAKLLEASASEGN